MTKILDTDGGDLHTKPMDTKTEAKRPSGRQRLQSDSLCARVTISLPPALLEAVDAAPGNRSATIVAVLERWAKRQAKAAAGA